MTVVSDQNIPEVAIIMGSDSDFKVMKAAADALSQFSIPFKLKVVSAHRTPKDMAEFAESAASQGFKVIIAGAGGAAHLPGMVASHTTLPVIGVPVPVGSMGGEDALWSIVQMPKGVPVATVAIGGAYNAGLLAAQICSLDSSAKGQELRTKLANYKAKIAEESRAKTLDYSQD